jgi:hypothetical protein
VLNQPQTCSMHYLIDFTNATLSGYDALCFAGKMKWRAGVVVVVMVAFSHPVQVRKYISEAL